jgi:hypothetical protein
MTSETRRELLKIVGELSAYCPEIRLGQLITNLATLAKGPAVEAIWDVEDEELLEAARRQLEVFQARNSGMA